MNRKVFYSQKANICAIMKPSYQAKKEGNAHASWSKSVLSGIQSGFEPIVCLQWGIFYAEASSMEVVRNSYLFME
ncbi:hypothetical protein H839_06424 [Parageobacillus genomosp. 1]|uniref:Uncharacterized protein n=1 Tax=Parageobacillus genomosp. 1 TaxID=1295642 RepID=A0ABC9VFL5_9BACL|nr:hypothetical protein H839_06424 [Parageobacillus genomosp. 1]